MLIEIAEKESVDYGWIDLSGLNLEQIRIGYDLIKSNIIILYIIFGV